MQTLPFLLPTYPYTMEEVQHRIQVLLSKKLPFTEQEAYRKALNCIDLTTLEGADTEQRVADLCGKAKAYQTAAVCVYPPFVAQAKAALAGTGIRVASVAGAFPAGQSPIHIKVAEVQYAVQQGADDIDMVISRGKFLEGKYNEVYEEICAIRQAAPNCILKVILETGELLDPNAIFQASFLAMKAGADFIKTSTGKITINATLEAFYIMLDAINQYNKEENRQVGIKPAGGIADPQGVLDYIKVLCNCVDINYLDKKTFRIGASRLAEKLVQKL